MKFLFTTLFLFAGALFAGEEQPLLDVLRSDASHQEKSAACRELARIGTAQAVPVLAPLLADETLSDMARFALETIDDPAADEELRGALAKVNGRQLVGMVHSLGVRGDPGSIEPLAKLLTHSDPAVARAAAHSLGAFGGAALPALGSALAKVAEPVRSAVIEGLLAGAEAVGGADAAEVYDKLRARSDLAPHQRLAALRGAVLTRGSDGLKLLAEAIRGEAEVPAAAAIGITLEMPGAEVTRMLIGEIEAAAEPEQILIVRELGRRGDAGAVAALASLARDGSPERRIAAIQGLAQIADPSSLPPLAALANDRDESIANEALAAVAGFPGSEADPFLLGLLDGARPGLKQALIEAIRQRRITKAAPELLELVHGPDAKVAEAGLRALRTIAGPGDIPGVVKALSRPSTAAAAEAALVAICARDPDSAPFSEKLAVSLANARGGTRLAILRVLGKNGDPTALAAVRTASRDADPAVKQAAARILAEWPEEPGFVPIFNGGNLSGWNGKPGWWGVADGALVSESTPEKPCTAANYLIWRGDTPADFELLVEFKISAEANSGIQIRSAELPEWDTFGYQADMTGDGSLIGFVYHHQYGLVAGRGEKVVFAADGNKTAEPIGDAEELLKHYKPDDWNTYHIVCRGPVITLSLNGTTMCEITDHRVTPAASRGVIALQMHPGPPMKAQFRNIRLKRL